MGKFDLAKPGDFAAAVTGSVGALLGALSGTEGRNTGDWDIQESSYKGVVFHVFNSSQNFQGAVSEVSDKGGRRKISLKYPYRDGQTTDDLGREPESFSFNILLFGNNYRDALEKLLEAFNSPTPGDLVHPVRGTVNCVVTEWTITHRSEQRKAVALQATFAEHNFSVITRSKVPDKSVKSAIGAALQAIEKIESAILTVNGLVKFGLSFQQLVKTLLEEYKIEYAQLLSSINLTFNPEGAGDFPALLPVSQGGVQSSTPGTLVQDNFSVASTTLSSVTAQALSTQELSKSLNSTRATLNETISAMRSGGGGLSALELYADILGLQETSVALQDAYEKGLSASQAKIVRYVVPRLMSVREIAFDVGISLDRCSDIDVLNPGLASLNFIEEGTVVRVPTE
jgi:hypothetical protein